MSPRELAKLIAQSAMAQLRVAVDQGVVLSVQTAEDIAIAIGAGAAQQLSNLSEEMDDEPVRVSCTDTPEVMAALADIKRARLATPVHAILRYRERVR